MVALELWGPRRCRSTVSDEGVLNRIRQLSWNVWFMLPNKLTALAVMSMMCFVARPSAAQDALATQGSTAASAPTACTYITCAIRLEPAFLGARLVRGATSEPTGDRLGGFGGGVDPLLAGPDSSAAFAREFVVSTKRSTILTFLGVAAFETGYLLSRTSRADEAAIAAVFVGIGLEIAAVPSIMRAQRSLSKAIWWYNAALPH